MLRNERHSTLRSRPIIPGTVFYESFDGNGALDNPEAIFRVLLARAGFEKFVHIWAVEPASSRSFRAEFAHHPRVRFVRPRSGGYTAALARSEYLINNATFPPEFQKREGQKYLNTWHGTPLKRMGYDMPGGAFDSANTLRNFVMADVLLSQNAHMTQMYLDSYRLAGILPGRIIEAGYPRTDRQFLDARTRQHADAALAAAGIVVGSRKVVLFAPTWKGTNFGSPRAEANDLLATVARVQALIGEQYLVLLKVHQAVARGMGAAAGRGVLVPNEMATNVMLGLTDTLVTDYSSIFIDFLATDRPIVFYTPDRDDYAHDRGTYFTGPELPGAVATTPAQLADAIVHRADSAVIERADRWRRDFTARDDGRATERVIDAVFAPSAELNDARQPRRPSVLLYVGGMRSNGITTSAINLLAHLDHDLLDVSVIMTRPAGEQQRANAARIHPRVRQFQRRGGFTGRRQFTLAMRILERLRPNRTEHAWETRLWNDEWRRCVGDATFDTVIDFSGYSRLWAQIMLHSPPARRLIWLHNDMAAEVDRPVNGRRSMRRSLPGVFALYPRFEALVSVSATLAKVNSDGVSRSHGALPERYLAARNVIDEKSARRMLATPLNDAPEFRDEVSGRTTIPSWATQIQHKRGIRWFVTVGRLSAEKNQARLLDAFAVIHHENPDTRLIIVGDGALRGALELQRAALGLSESVVFTGALANPFAVLARADCFVLSSDYEGQPMVLLEAAVAALPIVTVRFDSVLDALPGTTMHIVPRSVAGLAAGLRDFLEGKVEPTRLDAEDYNARALREFTDLLAPGPSESSSEADSSTISATSASTATPTLRATTTPTTTGTATTRIHTM